MQNLLRYPAHFNRCYAAIRRSCRLIERQVEQENIDSRLPEKAELPGLRMRMHQCQYLIKRLVPGVGDTSGLKLSICGGDVGIETRCGGSDHIDGHSL